MARGKTQPTLHKNQCVAQTVSETGNTAGPNADPDSKFLIFRGAIKYVFNN